MSEYTIPTTSGLIPNWTYIAATSPTKEHIIHIKTNVKLFIRLCKDKYEYGTIIDGVYRVLDYLPFCQARKKKLHRDFVLDFQDLSKRLEHSY